MYSLGHLNLRATYASGFRAPGLDELYYHYFSVNRGKAQISFGNQDLKPEKSNYFALNAEYRTQTLAVSVTGYLNRINDMVVKENVDVDDASRKMLMAEFPEMTQDQADKMVSYARSQQLTANSQELTWQPLERSIRHAATFAANYHHSWRKYALNVNLNGRLQSKTYYTGTYEDAPGFGPGSKEDITPAVLEAMQKADSIVGYKYYFQFIEPYVKPGCECIDTGMKKERERAEQAFQKAASLLGAPIGHDMCIISLSDLMTPWEVIERRIKAAAGGDFVTAVYNPKSHGRYWQLYRLQELFLKVRSANTPVGYVRQAGREEQEVKVTTLGDFNPEDIDMFTVILIGNSQSYIADGKIITPRGYYRETPSEEAKPGQQIMI